MRPICKSCHGTVQKAYYGDHVTERITYSAVYHESHREAVLAKQKIYRSGKDKDKQRVYKKIYEQNRRSRDVWYRVQTNLRCRIGKAVKGNLKEVSTMKLVGCSIKELRSHLERQFLPGMTWSNYGFTGWHIDHIKPCADFDLSDPNQQAICFHWSNLQPLWALDNLKKGRRKS